MSIKTTRKQIESNCQNIRSAGYCELQCLLRGEDVIAHTEGVYGWNFDVYRVNGLTICTGYRNMPGKRLVDCGRFERAAEKITSDGRLDYNERQEELCLLLQLFCMVNGGRKMAGADLIRAEHILDAAEENAKQVI